MDLIDGTYMHVVHTSTPPLSRSFWLSVCLCVQSVYYWLRGTSALLAANSCTRCHPNPATEKLIELWLTTQTHAPPAAMSTAMGGDGLSEVRSPSPMFRASKSVLRARAPPEGSLLRRLSSGSSVPGNGSLHSAGMDATEPGPRWFSWAAAVLTAPWSVDGRGPLEDALPSL